MRRLAKGAAPPILTDNAVGWLAEYIADKASNTKKYRYRHPDIKEALRVETSWKCAYCESKIGHNTPGDIEHKVPSSRQENLHFEWGNLTIACTECNRRKNDYYELGQEFLDPYVDDVEDCLVHLGPLVYWKPNNPRAEVTVRTLEMDGTGRAPLIDRKRELLEKARALLETVAAAGDPLLQALRRDEVQRMCEADAEFSAMVKTYVDLVGG
jgi:hypothetical protein